MTGITRFTGDGYQVHMLDDGSDYWDMLKKVEAGHILCHERHGTNERSVAFFRHAGREFVLKYDRVPANHLEYILSELFLGPVYSRIMRKINDAAHRGCDFVQRLYLVAEKMRWGRARESVILAEFIPGVTLKSLNNIPAYRDAIRDRMIALHNYGLAFVDPNHKNFIVTPDGLKIIDLTFRHTFAVAKAKDVVRVKERYDVDIPATGLVTKVAVGIIRANHAVKRVMRKSPM